MIEIIFFIVKFLNSLILKSKDKVIFISRPDFSDNARYMYLYLMEQNINKQLSWIVYDKSIYRLLVKKGYKNIFYLKSLQGMWEYVRSKYIVTSSGSLWQIKSPFQKQFDLWHGIPLKTIACMGEKGILPKRQAGNITMRFATSQLEKAQLAASFDYNAMKIHITGQPRTDVLFDDTKNLSKVLDENISIYKKIVLYMPTYRHGFKGKDEGNKFKADNIFRMNGYNHKAFLEYLEKEKILFLIKLHPFEEKIYQNIELGSNIRWLTNELLLQNDLTAYDILSEVDVLVTDYSSIYFDFLLLDRKIVFLPLDLDDYQNKRGFQLEPYDFWTPGKKVFDQTSLENELLVLDDLIERTNRKNICDIMFKYQDNRSAERVYGVISKYLGA